MVPYMLETGGEHCVPGTVFLNDAAGTELMHDKSANLKRATGKNSHIILAPQPSKDPNDPLNWHKYERILIFSILVFGTIINAATAGPLLAAGLVQISVDLGVSVQSVALVTGYNILATGASGPFVSIFSRKYGKRPQYLIASTFALLGVIIGEVAQNYDQLLASRIVHGFGTAAYESIVLASIGDLFFVHERGKYIAFAQFTLAAVSNGVSVISGVITSRLGWHYNYHTLVAFVALQWILVVFFVPETSYRRSEIYEVDITGNEQELNAKLESQAAMEVENVNNLRQVGTEVPTQRDSFWQRMRPCSVKNKDVNILKSFLALPAILLNLGAAFNILLTGIIVAWYVATTLATSLILALPPYNFTSATIGYASTGPFLGGLLGFGFMFLVSDSISRYMTDRNDGTYEPEFRLPISMLGLLFTVGGFVGTGYAIRDMRSIYIISTLWGVSLFGIFIIVVSVGQYTIDAWRQHSTEIFVMNALFKNFFFYGITNFALEWVEVEGPVSMFATMAGISVAATLTGVPLYIWGKRYRSYWHRNNLLEKWHLESNGLAVVEG